MEYADYICTSARDFEALKYRAIHWIAQGLPGCDPNIKSIVTLLNKSAYVAPVMSCEGHAVITETKKVGWGQTYFNLAVLPEGLDLVGRVYASLRNSLTQKGSRQYLRHINHPATVAWSRPDEPGAWTAYLRYSQRYVRISHMRMGNPIAMPPEGEPATYHRESLERLESDWFNATFLIIEPNNTQRPIPHWAAPGEDQTEDYFKWVEQHVAEVFGYST